MTITRLNKGEKTYTLDYPNYEVRTAMGTILSVNYIIELKFNQSAEKALEQIDDRKYYEVLQNQNKPTILLGLNFNRKPNEFDITYVSKEINKS